MIQISDNVYGENLKKEIFYPTTYSPLPSPLNCAKYELM
jgi:hypothetical protein